MWGSHRKGWIGRGLGMGEPSPSMVGCRCSCIRRGGRFRRGEESSDGWGKIDPIFILFLFSEDLYRGGAVKEEKKR